MHLTLTHHPTGPPENGPGNRAIYDIENDQASPGEAVVAGPALLWELHETAPPPDALLTANVMLDPEEEWLMRCDRVDFPPSGVAYRHTHPGPGIRCQLFGELTVETGGAGGTYGPLEAWFETGPDAVYAEASATGPAAFVRVMLLPAAWRGRRTIRYVDPLDDEKPKLQKATVFFDCPISI